MMDASFSFPSETATVSWVDGNGFNLHVFSGDGYNVTQRSFNGSWVDGTLAVPGNNVSATAWVDNAGAHIRVYCTGSDKTVEWCLDPDSTTWYQGGYTTADPTPS